MNSRILSQHKNSQDPKILRNHSIGTKVDLINTLSNLILKTQVLKKEKIYKSNE